MSIVQIPTFFKVHSKFPNCCINTLKMWVRIEKLQSEIYISLNWSMVPSLFIRNSVGVESSP